MRTTFSAVVVALAVVSLAAPRTGQHRASQHRASQHRASQHRASQHRASQHRAAVTLLCGSYQHIVTSGARGTRYVVRNDNYGGRLECLRNSSGGPNFAIVSSGARRAGREPVAFPNIFRGCSWGVCSPGGRLPLRVSRLATLTSTWSTRQTRRGVWDAAYDIWFARHRCVSGQDGGAELMIWLNSHGLRTGRGRIVTVDHRRWHLVRWRTGLGHKHWNYLRFSLVGGGTAVRRLRIGPFIALARRHRLIRQGWWLTSVEAGFEIWRGGAGLRTTGFSVRLRAPGVAVPGRARRARSRYDNQALSRDRRGHLRSRDHRRRGHRRRQSVVRRA
ncbi:MAG: GH12 family glycosyl hydrolase domain-containing protein [Streptosporangiaceae bacterium]